MIKKLPSTTVPLTRALAEKFAGMKRGFCERPLSTTRIKNLVNEFKNGGGKLTYTWAVAILDGVEIRVDGQHTSHIFANGLCDPPEGAEVNQQYFICENAVEVGLLWSFFNSRKSVRTKGDVAAAYAGTDAALSSLSRREVNAINAGVEMALASMEIKPEDVCRLVIDNKDFSLFVDLILSTGDGPRTRTAVSKIIGRGPVIGAMYLTFVKDQKAAIDFWCAVRDGTNPDLLAADRVLHDYLKSTVIGYGSGGGCERSENDSRNAMMARCILAWNAWRQHREVKQLRYYGNIPKAV